MGLRIKSGHTPQLNPDGVVWIGLQLHGFATEMVDQSGVLWSVCERMDGSRSRAEIVEQVLVEHSDDADTDSGTVGEVVEFLVSSGWVEDTSAPLPSELSAREVERYQRGAEFLTNVDLRPELTGYALQARLKASKVTVLGLGGVGSAAATSLAASGVGRIHCVDHDVVELSNLNRQLLYTEADIGRSKVEVGTAHLRARNSDITVTGAELLLDGPESIALAVRDCDAFLLCADSPDDIPEWANEAAYRCGKPWLVAGYSGPKFSLACFVPGQTACLYCLRTAHRERQLVSGVTPVRPARSGRPQNAVIAPTAQIAGHYLAMETIRLLLGMTVQTAGRELHRYAIDYDEQYYLEARPLPDCPINCGAALSP